MLWSPKLLFRANSLITIVKEQILEHKRKKLNYICNPMAGSGKDSQPEWRLSRHKNDTRRGQYELEKKTPEEIANRKKIAAKRKANRKSSEKKTSSRNNSAADEPRGNSSSRSDWIEWQSVSSSSTRKHADSESSHRSSKTSKSSHKKGYAESTTSVASSGMPSQPPRYPVSTEPATNGSYGPPPPVQHMPPFNSPVQYPPNFDTPPKHEANPEPGRSHHAQQFPSHNTNRGHAPFHNAHNTDQGATSYGGNFGALEQSRTTTGTRAGNDPSYHHHHHHQRTDQSHGQQSDSFGRRQQKLLIYETNHESSTSGALVQLQPPKAAMQGQEPIHESSPSPELGPFGPPKAVMQGQEPITEPASTYTIPMEPRTERYGVGAVSYVDWRCDKFSYYDHRPGID
ncbi:hypothetical protein V8F33_009695 [Rhypophila sp. PSN 637]